MISIWQGDLSTVSKRQWGVVVVNILAPIIIKLLDSGDLLHYVRPGGCLILSGIIDAQQIEVENAVNRAGGAVVSLLHRNDWVTLIVHPDSVKGSG